MSGFIFSLADNTFLENNSQGYFLVSKTPIKTLRINQFLFSILQKLQNGAGLAELIGLYPGIQEGRLLQIFLYLTYKGYLRLDKLLQPESFPLVSVIIPTHKLSKNLVECLESLALIDYPHDKLEVIVVEDGELKDSITDLSQFKIRRIQLQNPQGPAAARNKGFECARGEILAFLDSDCIADKSWLKELVPFLLIEGIGAVGGFVSGYYNQSFLDRYEEVSSSLNMGKRIIFEGNTESNFYVPTCNMLVSRKAFQAAGGFKNGMYLGEDVDFCWRMRKVGYALLYVPFGKIGHKHRNELFQMLHRRGAYGTSEAALYLSHQDKKKRFLLPIPASLSFIALVLAILLLSPIPLAFILLFLGIDLWQKKRTLERFKLNISFSRIGYSTLRSYFSFFYYTSFHLLRYYLILLLAFGIWFHPLFFFCAFALLLTSLVDYWVKKPKLNYPLFLFFYILEHMAYQIGVFWGCLKSKSFGSYVPVFSRTYPS